MKTRFIGDIHGKVEDYFKLLNGAKNSVQVGDFGVGFGTLSAPNIDRLYEILVPVGNHKFIRGNHDDPEEVKKSSHWIPDGTVDPDHGIMYIGGASSIDKAFRTKDLDWWENEQCSQEQLNELIDIYVAVKPKVMVTHEAPDQIFGELSQCSPFGLISEYSRTRFSLAKMFDKHKPETWIFGHWHHSHNFEFMGTRFICLPELKFIDLDI